MNVEVSEVDIKFLAKARAEGADEGSLLVFLNPHFSESSEISQEKEFPVSYSLGG